MYMYVTTIIESSFVRLYSVAMQGPEFADGFKWAVLMD